jgi:serine/threonine-protein kinase
MELGQVGKFKIVDKLGQGAMGEVFRALDPVLGREVAIKVVAGKLSEDQRARDRFLREARAAAQLNHPNIITVYDFGEEQGMAYMAMELLEGQDLRQILAKGTLTSLDDKLAIIEQILDGLAFAHSKGVVHRDLKPGNVHVLPNGQIKIMDFGLARRLQDAAASGAVMGTPYYMAPEQAQGDRATARSDIFSLGAMFYEMLAGRRPFTGSTIPKVLLAVVQRDPEPLGKLVPDLPTGIVAMVMRALAKDPQARHADAGEMLKALHVAWAGGELAPEEAAFAADDPTPARELGQALSALADTGAELRASLDEIEQYLADRVPPLMVVDSVGASAAPADPQRPALGLREGRVQPELRRRGAQHAAGGRDRRLSWSKTPCSRSCATGLVAQACPGEERATAPRALTPRPGRDGERAPASPGRRRWLTLMATTPGLRLSLLEQRLRREA